MSSTSPRLGQFLKKGINKLRSTKALTAVVLSMLLLTAVVSTRALAASNGQSYFGQITASISGFFGLGSGSRSGNGGTSSVQPQPQETPPESDQEKGDGFVPVAPENMPKGDVYMLDAPDAPIPAYTEVEPNDTSATANTPPAAALGSVVTVNGNISVAGDLDYFQIAVPAGGKVWAYTDTDNQTGGNGGDTILQLIAPDGTTLLESNDDSGSSNGLDGTLQNPSRGSSIAGRTVGAAGNYFVRVSGFNNSLVTPYRLFVVVTNAAPLAETGAANDSTATAQPLATSPGFQVVAGTVAGADTTDYYSVTVAAGDVFYFSLDNDPERDAAGFTNNTLTLRDPAGNVLFTANRAPGGANPSQAFGWQFNTAGTYFLQVVNAGGGDAAGTYNLLAATGPNAAAASSVVNFTPTTYTVVEGNNGTLTIVNVVVTRTGPGSATQTSQIDVATAVLAGDTATSSDPAGPPAQQGCAIGNGVDFIKAAQTFTFTPLQNTFTLPVTICGDNVPEGISEKFSVILSNPVNTTAGTPPATVTITDDDAAPTITVSPAATAPEGQNVNFTVTQSGASGVATQFTYQTTDGTATGVTSATTPPNGTDYIGTVTQTSTGVARCTATGAGVTVVGTAANTCRVTLAAGTTTATISIPTLTDILFEGPETFNLSINATSNVGNCVGGPSATCNLNAVGTITDLNAAPSYSINDVKQAEGNPPPVSNQATFTVTRTTNSVSQYPQTICYHTQAGNVEFPIGQNPATPGTAPGNPPNSDYTEITPGPLACTTLAGSLTAAGNITSFTIPVVIYADTTPEQDETYTVILDSVTTTSPPFVFGTPDSTISDKFGLGTIQNDDLPTDFSAAAVNCGFGGLITFQAGDVGCLEGDSSQTTGPDLTQKLIFRVSRPAGSAAQDNQTVCYSATDGTATAPYIGSAQAASSATNSLPDYLPFSTTPDAVTGTPANCTVFTQTGAITSNGTVLAGVNSVDIPVTILGDTVYELHDRVRFSITSVSNGGTFATTPTANGLILNDDAAPVFTVDDNANCVEGGPGTTTPCTVQVRKVGASDVTATVNYTTVDGLAQDGNPITEDTDYVAQTGVLTFGLGVATQPVNVVINGDNVYESPENLTVQLTAATVSPGTSATLTSTYCGFGNGCFVPGTLPNNLNTAAANNARALNTAQGADPVGQLTIPNDDAAPVYQIANSARAEGSNGGLTPLPLRITRTGATALASSICFTTRDGTAQDGINAPAPAPADTDTDYIFQQGCVTYAPGDAFQDVTVQVIADTKVEADETFFVDLLSATNGTIPTLNTPGRTGTGTITNDDTLNFTVTRNVTGAEGTGGGNTIFTFRIERPTTGDIASAATASYTLVNGTATGGASCATPGVDFINTGGTPASPVAFAPGVSFVDVGVQVCPDANAEADETFFFRLTGATPVGATFSTLDGIGTITNDDGTPTPTPLPTATPTPTPTPAPGFEGDINRTAVGVPGPGDGDVNVGDQIQYQRFLAGTDCPAAGTVVGNLNEQQRLDAGPRTTLGDGVLGGADGTAIDAYARHDATTDFDPNTPGWQPTPAGGPKTISNLGCTPTAAPENSVKTTVAPEAPEAARAIRLVSASGPANTDVFVEVEYEAQATDTAGLQFSLHFDPAVASISNVSGVNTNPDVTLGQGAPAGTTLNVNAQNVATGDIGIGVNFNGANTTPPTLIAIGTKRIVRLKFHTLPGAAVGVSPVTFTNTVVTKGVFDGNGIAITTPPFTDGNITVTGARTLKIGSSSTRVGGTALIPVSLTATGSEFGVSLTVNFDPTLLSITGVQGTDILPGSAVLPANCVTTINNTAVAQGRLGIGIGCPTGGIPVGIDEIFRLKFTARAAAVAGTQVPITFGNTPINTEVGDNGGNTLAVDKVAGVVTILGPTAAMVSVSGRVTTPNGSGLRNAKVTMTDEFGTVRSVTTSSFGFYQFDEVEVGSTYVVGVASRTYRFSSRTVSVTDNLVDMDFIGLE